MKWGWCDDGFRECHVIVYEVMIMRWGCWVSVVCEIIKRLPRQGGLTPLQPPVSVFSKCDHLHFEVRMMWWCFQMNVMCLCMKWGWCDDVVEWVSCVFVNKVRMMWWCCWVSVMCLCMKWGWCDETIECEACVFVWSEDDVMRLLNETHVFVYEVRMMWWWCWVSVMCLSMK